MSIGGIGREIANIDRDINTAEKIFKPLIQISIVNKKKPTAFLIKFQEKKT